MQERLQSLLVHEETPDCFGQLDEIRPCMYHPLRDRLKWYEENRETSGSRNSSSRNPISNRDRNNNAVVANPDKATDCPTGLASPANGPWQGRIWIVFEPLLHFLHDKLQGPFDGIAFCEIQRRNPALGRLWW